MPPAKKATKSKSSPAKRTTKKTKSVDVPAPEDFAAKLSPKTVEYIENTEIPEETKYEALRAMSPKRSPMRSEEDSVDEPEEIPKSSKAAKVSNTSRNFEANKPKDSDIEKDSETAKDSETGKKTSKDSEKSKSAAKDSETLKNDVNNSETVRDSKTSKKAVKSTKTPERQEDKIAESSKPAVVVSSVVKSSSKSSIPDPSIPSTKTSNSSEKINEVRKDMLKILEEEDDDKEDDDKEDDKEDDDNEKDDNEEEEEDDNEEDYYDEEEEDYEDDNEEDYDEDSDIEEDINIENILADYNIVAKSRVVKDNYVKYVEVLTPLGQKAYVHLNDSGKMLINEQKDTILKEGPVKVEHSTKKGFLECLDNVCSGIVIACDDGLCFLRKAGIKPKECTYVYHKNKPDKSVRLDSPDNFEDLIDVYPLINFKDIKSNHKISISSIDKVTKKLRDTDYRRCLDTLDKTYNNVEYLIKEYEIYSKKQLAKYKKTLGMDIKGMNKPLEGLKSLYKYFGIFINEQKKASKDLTNSVIMLEKILAEYDKYPPRTDEDKQSFSNLVYNLEKRQELCILLIKICSSYRPMYEDISDLISIIEDPQNNNLLDTTKDINETINKWGNKIVKDIELISEEYTELEKAFVR